MFPVFVLRSSFLAPLYSARAAPNHSVHSAIIAQRNSSKGNQIHSVEKSQMSEQKPAPDGSHREESGLSCMKTIQNSL